MVDFNNEEEQLGAGSFNIVRTDIDPSGGVKEKGASGTLGEGGLGLNVTESFNEIDTPKPPQTPAKLDETGAPSEEQKAAWSKEAPEGMKFVGIKTGDNGFEPIYKAPELKPDQVTIQEQARKKESRIQLHISKREDFARKGLAIKETEIRKEVGRIVGTEAKTLMAKQDIASEDFVETLVKADPLILSDPFFSYKKYDVKKFKAEEQRDKRNQRPLAGMKQWQQDRAAFEQRIKSAVAREKAKDREADQAKMLEMEMTKKEQDLELQRVQIAGAKAGLEYTKAQTEFKKASLGLTQAREQLQGFKDLSDQLKKPNITAGDAVSNVQSGGGASEELATEIAKKLHPDTRSDFIKMAVANYKRALLTPTQYAQSLRTQTEEPVAGTISKTEEKKIREAVRGVRESGGSDEDAVKAGNTVIEGEGVNPAVESVALDELTQPTERNATNLQKNQNYQAEQMNKYKLAVNSVGQNLARFSTPQGRRGLVDYMTENTGISPNDFMEMGSDSQLESLVIRKMMQGIGNDNKIGADQLEEMLSSANPASVERQIVDASVAMLRSERARIIRTGAVKEEQQSEILAGSLGLPKDSVVTITTTGGKLVSGRAVRYEKGENNAIIRKADEDFGEVIRGHMSDAFASGSKLIQDRLIDTLGFKNGVYGHKVVTQTQKDKIAKMDFSKPPDLTAIFKSKRSQDGYADMHLNGGPLERAVLDSAPNGDFSDVIRKQSTSAIEFAKVSGLSFTAREREERKRQREKDLPASFTKEEKREESLLDISEGVPQSEQEAKLAINNYIQNNFGKNSKLEKKVFTPIDIGKDRDKDDVSTEATKLRLMSNKMKELEKIDFEPLYGSDKYKKEMKKIAKKRGDEIFGKGAGETFGKLMRTEIERNPVLKAMWDEADPTAMKAVTMFARKAIEENNRTRIWNMQDGKAVGVLPNIQSRQGTMAQTDVQKFKELGFKSDNIFDLVHELPGLLSGKKLNERSVKAVEHIYNELRNYQEDTQNDAYGLALAKYRIRQAGGSLVRGGRTPKEADLNNRVFTAMMRRTEIKHQSLLEATFLLGKLHDELKGVTRTPKAQTDFDQVSWLKGWELSFKDFAAHTREAVSMRDLKRQIKAEAWQTVPTIRGLLDAIGSIVGKTQEEQLGIVQEARNKAALLDISEQEFINEATL